MTLRQNDTPVSYRMTTRGDRRRGMTSGRAFQVVPIHQIPLLRGDSLSGNFTCRLDLAEMPKPLSNAVFANVQAWFIPKSIHPQFSGMDEFIASYQGTAIKALGAADRDPPAFYETLTGSALTAYKNSTFLKALGAHLPTNDSRNNTDALVAYLIAWNFRAAAISNRIQRAPYPSEDLAASLELRPAFWPSTAFPHVVDDYERALLLGALDLDIDAGRMPVKGIGVRASANSEWISGTNGVTTSVNESGNPDAVTYHRGWRDGNGTDHIVIRADPDDLQHPDIFAEMADQTVATSLAGIETARTTQAMAKLRASYNGNDPTGYGFDETIIAEFMQGFRVPAEMLKRPWLLDAKRVEFGMVERHATDAANLDESVTVGSAAVNLSLNVPRTETGGHIIITAEVVPERLYERQGDFSLLVDDVQRLPDALRDIQRPEPVDAVANWRVDTAHSQPNNVYGFEPMNARWDRDFTSLGGIFYQTDPSNPFRESRAGVWYVGEVDPTFTENHYVCPVDGSHAVFSDTLAPAFELTFRSVCAIRGLTQIGDPLVEANDDYALTQE